MKFMNSVMENLKQPETDLRFMDSCLNYKKSGIKEVASCESTGMAGKEVRGGEKSKILVLKPEPSSSSNQYSLESEETPEILIGGGEGEEEIESLRCVSHGSMSVIGRRRTMEDAVSVAPGVLVGEFDSYDFFAVYDGHGGAMVANACRDRLHQLVAEEMEGWKSDDGSKEMDWEKVMTACFSKMDEEVGGSGELAKTAGSTAVVVMVGKEEVVVANCGDSRAVLCRGGAPIPLSCDHKPDRPDEKERVEAAGGRVIYWNGCRVLGVLATSRSIGDQYLKPYVISEPEITVNKRTQLDNFILIGSDGLWDAVSNDLACEIVRRCFDGEIKLNLSERLTGSCAAEAATMLAELAIARGSKDNISVIVVALKKSL